MINKSIFLSIVLVTFLFLVSIKKQMMPLQTGDVPETFSDTSKLEHSYGYKPKIEVEKGVIKFLDWYNEFYQVKLPIK